MVINKSKGHKEFFINNCKLYEYTKVFSKNNYILISEILWPDTGKLSDEEMVTISKILNGEEL